MKLLITGSRGFIGSSVGRLASARGDEVLGLGLASQPVPGWQGSYAQTNVAVSDFAGIIQKFKPDVLLHAAGAASVNSSLSSPLDDLKASAFTWANTLECVRRSGVRPLILFPSSAAVYGNPPTLPVAEESRGTPISPYGFHKAACELLAREYAECFGMSLVVCRLFSVFGAGQKRLLVWELFEQLASDAQTVWLQGTGKESRDYLHIADVASAFFELSKSLSGETSAAGCQFVNVASGIEVKVIELANLMRDLIAPHKEIRCRGIEGPGDPRAWQADISILQRMAPEWQPSALAEGLTECIDLWRRDLLASK